MKAKIRGSQGRRSASPRARILECAVTLFAAHGFEAMTMRMLGDAVGLDNSSLYRHFAGKTEIANAVLDHIAGDFLKTIEAHLEPSRRVTLKALENLAAIAGGYFFERQASARLMMHWVMSTGVDNSGFGISVAALDTKRPGGQLFAQLHAWLAEGVRGGALRKHAQPDGVIILFGAILLRPATYGYLLASLEPKRSRIAARKAWETELRSAVHGAFAP